MMPMTTTHTMFTPAAVADAEDRWREFNDAHPNDYGPGYDDVMAEGARLQSELRAAYDAHGIADFDRIQL